MLLQHTKCRLLMAAFGALLSSSAWSASLHVAPVSLRLAPGQGAVGITLSNPSDEPLVAQVRLFSWSQDVNDDHLAAQQDLVVSPPITNIPAHSEQTVRVVRPGGGDTSKELTYRLLIDELPNGADGANDAAAVDIRIRYSVPLFVAPGAPASDASVSWTLVHHGNDWFVQAVNRGGTHAQLSAVKLTAADGHDVTVAEGLLGYALAGSTRQWRVPASLDGVESLKISATINGHPMTASLDSPGADAVH
jgi:fimbrial chaperone protein